MVNLPIYGKELEKDKIRKRIRGVMVGTHDIRMGIVR
jgi:hypothetical protein